MKKFIHSVLLFARNSFFVFLLLATFSCSNSVIGDVNTSEIKASISSILSPQNLSASQGSYRKINLTWTTVSNAKQYLIYKANSPYDDFEKVGETSGNVNEFEYSVESGTTCWFRVSAVSYSEEESSLSSYVSGSSMAIPNITSIDLGTDGTSSTVTWWLSNCKSQTYENSVNFAIYCYKSDKLTQVGDTLYASGTERSVTFSGLEKKSTYYYLVKAYIGGGDAEDSAETSDFADAETARLTTPSAPENVSAEQGISTESSGNGIKISWTLPEAVDVKVSSGIYEEHPLYFTLERKLLSESESAYTTLASYLGTFDSSKASASSTSEIYFTCDSDASFGENDVLSVELVSTTEDDEIPNYENYRVGAKISYTDKSVVAGKQYTYRIRSYTDDVGTKKISSDSSYKECNAWLISAASLELKPTYETKSGESTKFASISVNFDFDFEDFGLDNSKFYTYVLTYQKTDFPTEANPNPTASEEKFLANFVSVEELKNYTKTYESDFLSSSENQGYYSYKVYICSSSISATENASIPSSSEYYEMISSSNFCSITDDSTKLPVISTFEVDDGYANKYVLKWNYDSACTYTIQWTEYDGTTEQPLSNSTQSLVLSSDDFTTSTTDGTTYATYNHSATSGDARKYTILADNGLQVTETYNSVCKTLGTASVSMTSFAYDSITVNWVAVQKADDYEVSAYYADDESKTELVVTSGEDKNTEILNSTSNGTTTYSCKITKPSGYDSALKSGKAITLKVTAKNSSLSDDNTTEGSASVCTFGPSLVNASVGTLHDSNILVKWNKVQGAAGYIIYRVLYSDSSADNAKIESSTDKYYYDVSSETLKRNGESTEDSNVSYVESSATYTLNDIDDASCADEISLNQRKISWGLPFGYVILPVLNDSDDFDFETSSLEMKSGENVGKAGVSYSDIASDESPAFVKNATFGYGLNVAASKSESSSSIAVTWDRPYKNDEAVPYIYRRAYGESTWKTLGSLNIDDVSYNDTLTDVDKTDAYYYAVQYHNSSATLSYKTAYENHLAKKDSRYADVSTTNQEELNKGYLFYFDFSASYNGTVDSDGNYKNDEYYYSEKVSHTPWNFNKRKRGPTNLIISAKNVNTTMDYIKLADITVDTSSGTESFTLNANNDVLTDDTSSDTKIVKSGSNLILSPIALTAGTAKYTEGILKVLRSTKTYYKLESTLSYSRTDGTSGDAELSQEVYGYRQITNDELARCIGLIIADGLYQMGIPKSGLSGWETSYCSGSIGTFTISHKAWDNYSQWGFGGLSYVHLFRAGTSSKYTDSYESEFTVVAGTSAGTSVGAKGHTLYYLEPLDLTVTHESGLASMQGTINFTAGSSGTSTKWNLTIKKGSSTIVSVSSDKSSFLNYFPYDIGSKHENADATVNTSLQTYTTTYFNWWN